jgi:zinc transport system substrate-binding protein
MAMQEHHHHDDKHKEKIHKEHNSKDPHIWTSPNNVKIIAKNIYLALVNIDKKNSNFYKKNYINFIEEINNTIKKINIILKDTPKDTAFMVFHPSWGYFAKQFNLHQIPIEIEGKSPKPKSIIYIMKEAKEEHIKAIFTSPEFSDKVAKQLAKELKIKVLKISPLSKDWSKNLQDFARAIVFRQNNNI